jgi:hypothetical protein
MIIIILVAAVVVGVVGHSRSSASLLRLIPVPGPGT